MPSPKQPYRASAPICPDGVPITIVWEKFEVGSSVFIPAVNTTKLIKQMHAVSRRLGIQVEPRHRIESGKLGVRFWRIL